MKIETKTLSLCSNQDSCTWRVLKTLDIVIYQPQPEPIKSLNDLKFGDEVEVRIDGGWRTAKFVSLEGSDVFVLLEGNSYLAKWKAFELTWRLPVKSRMRKGQPVFVGRSESLRIFSHLNGEKLYAFNSQVDACTVLAWKTWRLPTKDELEAIGHADGGWLTQD